MITSKKKTNQLVRFTRLMPSIDQMKEGKNNNVHMYVYTISDLTMEKNLINFSIRIADADFKMVLKSADEINFQGKGFNDEYEVPNLYFKLYSNKKNSILFGTVEWTTGESETCIIEF